MFFLPINYLAVFVAALLHMALGMAWYSPLLFGKMWMSLMGFTEEKMKEAQAKGMGKSMAIAFVAALALACIIAHFVVATATVTAADGMGVAIWLWGIIAATMTGIVLWEGKSWKLYGLHVGYYLVSFLIMGALLGVWR